MIENPDMLTTHSTQSQRGMAQTSKEIRSSREPGLQGSHLKPQSCLKTGCADTANGTRTKHPGDLMQAQARVVEERPQT